MTARQLLRDAKGRFCRISDTSPPLPAAVASPALSTDPLVHDGLVKTEVHCTGCNKKFIAELDFGIDGQHIIECPFCAHEHCRRIEKGRVTDDRWSSRSSLPTIRVERRRMWKHGVLQIRTAAASELIRERWLQTLTS